MLSLPSRLRQQYPQPGLVSGKILSPELILSIEKTMVARAISEIKFMSWDWTVLNKKKKKKQWSPRR